VVKVGGQSRIRVEYLRRIDGSIVYTPQAGDALTGWGPLSGVPVVTPIDATWERVVVEDVSGTGLPKRFGRVVMALP
jgi:hypothetical protein